jgi:hypothetical protein
VPIKGADTLFIGGNILVDRIQSAGPGTVNVNQQILYELGNYKSVGITRDIPDITSNCESYDVSPQFEALICGVDPASVQDGDDFDLSKQQPLDIVSQFKPGVNAPTAFDVIGSVAIPFMFLESATYKYGVTDLATQTFALRSDSMFYNPGAGVQESFSGTNTDNQVLTLTHPVYPYEGDIVAGTRYCLSVSLKVKGKRLVPVVDYTESATGNNASKAVTVTIHAKVPVDEKVKVVYATSDTVSYPQESHAAASSTRPAAVRGRDIEIRLGGQQVTDRLTNVQTVTTEWKVNLERNLEMGNQQIVSQDWFVPSVTGTVEIRPFDYAELYQRVRTIADVADKTVAGALTSKPLQLEIIVYSPTVPGLVLKTLYVPDARFVLPGWSGRVQQKLTMSLPWTSDTGSLTVYAGEK